MLSLLLLLISVLLFSTLRAEADYFRRPAKKVCLAKLKNVLSPLPSQVPAYQYFAPFEAKIRRQKDFLFNPATRSAYARSFERQNGITVRIRDANAAFLYPRVLPNSRVAVFQIERSWALNEGVTVRDGNAMFYTFPIFNDSGEMLLIILAQANLDFPFYQYCARPTRK